MNLHEHWKLMDFAPGLPPQGWGGLRGGLDFRDLSNLFTRLLEFDPHTRVVFTSREPLPEPFAADKR
ncbi:MAG: hypothetical protein KAX26_05210, partial [Anaerolineae bacterium]|nr:hypothetical protein [Anaerolineae bacterium]